VGAGFILLLLAFLIGAFAIIQYKAAREDKDVAAFLGAANFFNGFGFGGGRGYGYGGGYRGFGGFSGGYGGGFGGPINGLWMI
jgi:hypothetical protein